MMDRNDIRFTEQIGLDFSLVVALGFEWFIFVVFFFFFCTRNTYSCNSEHISNRIIFRTMTTRRPRVCLIRI